MVEGTRPARAAGGCVPARLRRRPRGPTRLELLAGGRLHERGRPAVGLRQLLDARPRFGLPHDRAAYTGHRLGGHGHVHRARVPVCALPRAGRELASTCDPARRDRPAAVGELPRARLLVAPHPQPGRRAQLGVRQGRASRPEHPLHELGDVGRLLLHLVPVHDLPGLRGSGEGSRLLPRSVGRSRREEPDDPAACRAAARGARHCGRLDLHVLAHAR